MKKFLMINLLVVLFLVIFLPIDALAAYPPTGGLMGFYVRGYQWGPSPNPIVYSDDWLGVNVTVPVKENIFADGVIENVNFPNFENRLFNVVGRIPYTTTVWRGAFKIDQAGVYDFEFICGNIYGEFGIDGSDGVKVNNYGDKHINNMYMDAGWHRIYIRYPMQWERYDAEAILKYKKDSEATYQVFANDHLSPVTWTDKEILIPGDGSTDKRLNFVTTGSGGGGGTDPQTEVKIKIDKPPAILTDDVYVLWYNNGNLAGLTPELIIENENPGGLTQTITGTSLSPSIFTQKYVTLYGKVPVALLADGGTGKIDLSFRNGSGLPFGDGVAFIVPFDDPNPTVPLGQQLRLKLTYSSGYTGASAALVIPLDSSQINIVSPVFFIADGETKVEFDSGTNLGARPNYLYMAYGSGSAPIETDILSQLPGAQRILPRANNLDLDDPDTWYPAMGRENRQLDVLSGNYVANEAPYTWNQYKNTTEGLINDGTEPNGYAIPAGNDWVAFQLYGLNFVGSGLTGGGESLSFTGGGVLSLPAGPPVMYSLQTNVVGDGKVTSSPGSIDCPDASCNESFSDGTNVVLTAVPNVFATFDNWTGACVGTNPVCTVNVNSDKTATANFTSFSIPGQCGEACNHTHCNIPTESFCTPPSTIAAPGTPQPSATGWTWDCEGLNGGATTSCQAERKCGWEEK